jgi:TonB family protein
MRQFIAAIGCTLLLGGCAGQAVNKPANPISQSTQADMPVSNTAATPAVQNPSYLIRYAPLYPGFEAVYGAQGTTHLLILVGKNGSPLDIKVERSSGWRSLDKAAVTAADQWRFNPEIKNGVAVDGYVRVPVAFHASSSGPAWPSGYQAAAIELDKDRISYAKVAEAVAAVAAKANAPVYDGLGNQSHTYSIYDDQKVLRELWYFTDITTNRAMAVRYTFAGTPDQPLTKVAVLCDIAGVCKQRINMILAGPYSVRMTRWVFPAKSQSF